MPRWLNIANIFTLVRLVLVPFIVKDILDGRHLHALQLFAVAAATDLLDGASARHFKLATQAGAYLDPIADKCLLSGVYLAFAAARIVPWWLVAVIFGRDLCILIGVAIVMLFTPVRRFPPSVWGKLSTFVQIVTAVLWMGRNALEIRLLETLSSAMIWPCAAMTLWSGLHYTWRGVLVARAH
jgi:cardiolipin synthase (CMP-forming)